MNTQQVTLVEPTKDNIEALFVKIKEYATGKGYQVLGEIALPTNMLGIKKSPDFKSKCMMKRVRTYMTSLGKKITMGKCNRFLHLLFRHVYGADVVPRVEYSTKELEIKASRKAWKKADAEARALQAKYKEVKGDFYKK
jgi:hypothetical protein